MRLAELGLEPTSAEAASSGAGASSSAVGRTGNRASVARGDSVTSHIAQARNRLKELVAERNATGHAKRQCRPKAAPRNRAPRAGDPVPDEARLARLRQIAELYEWYDDAPLIVDEARLAAARACESRALRLPAATNTSRGLRSKHAGTRPRPRPPL